MENGCAPVVAVQCIYIGCQFYSTKRILIAL